MNKPAAEPQPVDLLALVAEVIRKSPDPIAETAIGMLLPLAKNLTVIIGHNGFKALLDRSMHAAGKKHLWLVTAEDSSDRLSSPESLKAALSEQEPGEASQATALLFSTLLELLVALIGQALTLKLLSASWGIAFDPAVRGTQK
jgi:hypothetical protein